MKTKSYTEHKMNNKTDKLKYADRYTTLTVRFKPQEWASLCEAYEVLKESVGVDVSKHQYVKALIRAALAAEA